MVRHERAGSFSQSIDSESLHLPRVSPNGEAQEMVQLSQILMSTLTISLLAWLRAEDSPGYLDR